MKSELSLREKRRNMSENTTYHNNDDVPYNPDDENAVKSFWKDATVKQGRGKQKSPVKQQVTIRLSPQVLDYFKTEGAGWQTRIDQALQDYIAEHR